MNVSKRELEVLEWISNGFTTKEIADQLYISNHTVVTHRKKLLEKMCARNTAVLVRKAFEMGILQTH